jgi:hypothetical protein
MVVRLATALDVPLRHVNAMLDAAGYEPMYPEAVAQKAALHEVSKPLEFMKSHHEPYPLIVVDRTYRMVDFSDGAVKLLTSFAGVGAAELDGLNLARLTFAAASLIANFDEVGRALLWRIQREVLEDPDEGPLNDLLDELLAMPIVAPDWREPDLSVPSSPALVLHLKAGDIELRFMTLVTAFQAPQSVLLDELRIETWFPADSATAEWFE